MNFDPDKTWIGMAHVKPGPGNGLLEGARGAFVPVVALAEDEEDFASLVASLLNLYKFEVITVEDIELLRRRLEHGPLEKEIVELAKGLTPDDPIALSQFEAYESE